MLGPRYFQMFTILSNLYLFLGPLPGQCQEITVDQDPPKAPWKRVPAQVLEPWCSHGGALWWGDVVGCLQQSVPLVA